MNWNIGRDVTVCLVLMLAGLVLGSSYVRITRQAHLAPAMPDFSRRVFGAAAMHVCGFGLRTPDVTANALQRSQPEHRPMVEFIEQRRETLACGDIPAGQPAGSLDGMQRASGYLTHLIVNTWALTGVTWAGIDYLQGAMFGISVGLTYLIGRLAMGPLTATVLAVVLLLSPIQLINLSDLRDYAKTPFFLASLLLAGFLVTRRSRPRVIVGCCAAGGAWLGFGFGIRTDVIVNLLLLVGVALACLPGRLVDTWRLRLLAAAACVLGFVVVASPILASQSSGNNLWHWALLGYAHDWDRALDIIPAPYEPMYFYSDSYVATTIDAFAGRTSSATAQVSVGVSGYGEVSQQYFMELVRIFPADALLRGWAAVIQVLNLPFGGAPSLSQGILPDTLTRAIELISRVRVLFAGLGTALFAVTVLGLSAWSVRHAASLFGVVAFLGAYTAIQFQLRHVFHLELLSVWMLCFLLSAGWARIVRRGRGVPGENKGPGCVWWRPFVFALCVLALVTLPMMTLRAYQQRAATALFESYTAAPQESLAMSVEQSGPEIVRIGKHALPEGPMRSMRSDMIVAEISADRCPVRRTVVGLSYDSKNPDLDFTRQYEIEVPQGGQGTAKMFLPVYRSSPGRSSDDALTFGGIQMAPGEEHCLKGLSRFVHVDQHRILIPVLLSPTWRATPLRQTLRGWERDVTGGEPSLVVGAAVPRSLVTERLSRADSVMTPFAAAVAYSARIAQVGPNGRVDVDGVATATGSYLAAWEDSVFDESNIVLVEGDLVRGGLAVGLTNTDGWATRVEVETPGPFRAVIKVPRSGRYQLVIANHLSSTSLRNRFTISRIAVLN